MTDRELDAAIAEKVMGLCFHEWNKRIIPECVKCGVGYIKHGKDPTKPLPYSTDRNAAALALERIEELGLHYECVNAIMRITHAQHLSRSRQVHWIIITTAPRQLMEAALAAVGVSLETGTISTRTSAGGQRLRRGAGMSQEHLVNPLLQRLVEARVEAISSIRPSLSPWKSLRNLVRILRGNDINE